MMTWVVGGADGFGAAIVDRFHQEKSKVIFIDLNNAKGQAKVADKPELVFLHGDVTRRETWDEVLNLAVSRFGRLDVVINNAG